MHFLLQKEVVDRLAASPGTKDWGRLSILAQYGALVEPLFDVAPEMFPAAPESDVDVRAYHAAAESAAAAVA